MAWNRVQYKEQGRAQADAENSPRWSSVVMSAQFSLVFDMGWRKILSAFPTYRYRKLTVTPNSDGVVSMASLRATVFPDRIFRLLDRPMVYNSQLASNGDVVRDPVVNGDNVQFGQGISGALPVWLSTMPVNPENIPVYWGDVNADGVVTAADAQQVTEYSVGLPVTNLPALLQRGDVDGSGTIDIFDAQQISRYAAGLAPTNPTAAARLGTAIAGVLEFPAIADTRDVVWPDGYEMVLAYHLAAMLLTKGAVETGAAADLFVIVDQLYTDMLQALMRPTTKRPTMGPSDDVNDWNAAGMNY